MPIRHVTKALTMLQKKLKHLQSPTESEEALNPIVLPEEEKVQKMVVEISIWSSLRVILLIAAFYLGFQFLGRITNILILLFFSIFLATTFSPGVDKLEKLKVPRGLGCIVLMIMVVSIFFGILGGVIPIIGGEVAKIWQALTDFAIQLSNQDFSNLPLWMQGAAHEILPLVRDYFNRVSPEELQSTITNFAKDNLVNSLEQVSNVAGKGISIVIAIFGGLFQTTLVFILTFFLVVEKGNITKFFIQLFPRRYAKYLSQKATAVENKVAGWVHGQITLFFLVAVIAYVGLTILGVEYALTLALIAGLAEFIPYVGPVIAFSSAAPVAFNESFSLGVAVMVFYAGIQAVEGNVLVPLVMKKAVGLSPVVTIVAMLIGWEFLGIMGMILAIPLASIVALFVDDYSAREQVEESTVQKKKDSLLGKGRNKN